MSRRASSTGLVNGGGYQAVTAATTQTQAAATAITAGNVACTTGNASDGVALPRADKPTHIGQELIIQNVSANAMKVYPFYDTELAAGSGGTIDGGSANASVTQGASTTYKYICTAKDTWKSIKLS